MPRAISPRRFDSPRQGSLRVALSPFRTNRCGPAKPVPRRYLAFRGHALRYLQQ